MDTSAEATGLKPDNDGLAQLITAVSSSSEERRSSDVEYTFTDVKLPENGEVMSKSISDCFAVDGNKDSNFYTKHNIPGLSLLMHDESPVKRVEDKIIPDSHDMDRDDSRVHLDQVSSTNVDTAGSDDDDGEIADSRSQTPLQDEVEPEVADLNQNQVAGTSDTKLGVSVVVNRSGDSTEKTKPECTASSQKSGEENGEVSDDDDDDDDDGITDSKGNIDSMNQQVPGDVKPQEEQKVAKELEKQKVCLGPVQQQSCDGVC